MPISLQKGQKVSLTKNNPGLSKVVVGLGPAAYSIWEIISPEPGMGTTSRSKSNLLKYRRILLK